MLDQQEVRGFYDWLNAQRHGKAKMGTDAAMRAISEIEFLKESIDKLGREPVFAIGGRVAENMAAIGLYHWRRRVAESIGGLLPPDPMAAIKKGIEAERIRREARQKILEERQEAARLAKEAARREAGRRKPKKKVAAIPALRKAKVKATKATALVVDQPGLFSITAGRAS